MLTITAGPGLEIVYTRKVCDGEMLLFEWLYAGVQCSVGWHARLAIVRFEVQIPARAQISI